MPLAVVYQSRTVVKILLSLPLCTRFESRSKSKARDARVKCLIEWIETSAYSPHLPPEFTYEVNSCTVYLIRWAEERLADRLSTVRMTY